MSLDELLALAALGLPLEPEEERELEAALAEDPALADRLVRDVHAAALLAEIAEPVADSSALAGGRARLLASAGAEPLAPFVDALASLFDLARERARELLALFETDEGWTPLFPGAAFIDLEGGPAIGGQTVGLVRIAPGLHFPAHRHLGEETVLVLQGAFVDGDRRVEPGDQVTMPDGSRHDFRVVSEVELRYAVVVNQVEFDDGTRAP